VSLKRGGRWLATVTWVYKCQCHGVITVRIQCVRAREYMYDQFSFKLVILIILVD